METGATIALVGLSLILMPVVQMLKDGVASHEDFIQWVMSHDLHFIFLLRSMTIAGAALTSLGVSMMAMG